MADVFVAYARSDRARVAPMVTRLEAEGLSVWWDPKIPLGDQFADIIDAELKAAKCVLTAWSNAAIRSRYVREEAEYALQRGILVPVRIDHCELPYGFRSIQTADLKDWRGNADHPEWQKVFARVAQITGRRDLIPKSPPERGSVAVREVYPNTVPRPERETGTKGRPDSQAEVFFKGLVRYVLLILIVAIVVIGILNSLSSDIGNAFNTIGDNIREAVAT